MTIGEFIKRLAREKGSSAAKIERELGFSNGYIGNSRDKSFPYERLVMIADYLGVTPEYLSSCGNVVESVSSASSLTDAEEFLLLQFRRLDEFDRGKVAGYVDGLLASAKYIKTGAASAETA